MIECLLFFACGIHHPLLIASWAALYAVNNIQTSTSSVQVMVPDARAFVGFLFASCLASGRRRSMAPANKKIIVATIIAGAIAVAGGLAYVKYTQREDEEELVFDVESDQREDLEKGIAEVKPAEYGPCFACEDFLSCCVSSARQME